MLHKHCMQVHKGAPLRGCPWQLRPGPAGPAAEVLQQYFCRSTSGEAALCCTDKERDDEMGRVF